MTDCTSPMPGPVVERDEQLSLRTVEREDIPFLQKGFTAPEIRYPLGRTTHRNLDEVEDQFNPDNQLRFLVCVDEDTAPMDEPDESEVRPIGMASVTGAESRRPGLTYWLIPAVHGNGYGKATVSLVINYVLRVFDTPAIGAAVFDFNTASRGLLESLGFTQEGRLRKFQFVDGEYRDLIQYGLLRSEWQD